MSKGVSGVQKNPNATSINESLPQRRTFLIMRRALILYAKKSLVSSIAVQYILQNDIHDSRTAAILNTTFLA